MIIHSRQPRKKIDHSSTPAFTVTTRWLRPAQEHSRAETHRGNPRSSVLSCLPSLCDLAPWSLRSPSQDDVDIDVVDQLATAQSPWYRVISGVSCSWPVIPHYQEEARQGWSFQPISHCLLVLQPDRLQQWRNLRPNLRRSFYLGAIVRQSLLSGHPSDLWCGSSDPGSSTQASLQAHRAPAHLASQEYIACEWRYCILIMNWAEWIQQKFGWVHTLDFSTSLVH